MSTYKNYLVIFLDNEIARLTCLIMKIIKGDVIMEEMTMEIIYTKSEIDGIIDVWDEWDDIDKLIAKGYISDQIAEGIYI